MAKKTGKSKAPGAAPADAVKVPAYPELEPSVGDEPIVIVPAPYSFPTRSRCPRCGSLDTTSTGTHDGVQYRVCRMPVCRTPYKVQGQRV